MTLNVVDSYSQLMRECTLGLFGSFNILVRAALMIVFKENVQCLKLIAWATACIHFVGMAMNKF